MEIFWTVDPGRRSRTRFALGYYLSGLQPFAIDGQKRMTIMNDLNSIDEDSDKAFDKDGKIKSEMVKLQMAAELA